MGYTGPANTDQFKSMSTQTITGDGSATTFTLNTPVANSSEIRFVVNNVVQKADKVIVLKGNRNEIYRTVMSEKSRDDGKLEFVTEFHPETMTFKRIEVWKEITW